MAARANRNELRNGGGVYDRRKRILMGVTSGVLAAMLGSKATYGASANWSATPTNGFWEAGAGETNWSTGVNTFPGTLTAGSVTNVDQATFNGPSSSTTISINGSTSNSSSLNLGIIFFTSTTAASYTIGSTLGNALVMSTLGNANQGATTDQIAISGGGRTGATTAITETINSPIILAPQAVGGAGGFYVFQNASGAVSNGDKLIFNGSITPAASTSAATLTLTGANTNVNNAVNGNITDGSATGGLKLFKNGVGTWTLGGNNTYTGTTTVTNGNLRITGTYTGGALVDLLTGGAVGGITYQSSGTSNFGNVILDGGNSFFTVNSGTAVVGMVSEVVAGTLSASRHVDVNGGTLKLTADWGTIVGPPFTQGPGVLNLNGGTVANGKNAPTGGVTLFLDSFLSNSTVNHSINIGANGGTFDTTLGNISAYASTSPVTLNGTTATSTVSITGGNTLQMSSTAASTFLMSPQGTSTWDYNGVASQVGGLTGNGVVTNSGSATAPLTVNLASGTQTFAGNLGGSNAANVSLIKNGAGSQVMSGTSSFTGTTTVNAGALIVTGSMTGSAVTVNAGGTLAGNGSLGSVVLGSSSAGSSTLLPGTTAADGSVGTITMASLDATNGGTGSTAAVRLDLVTPGASDSITVSGAATFSGTNTFTLLGTPAAGTYTLVQAGAPLAGTSPNVVLPSGTRETFAQHFGDGTSGPNAFTLVVTGNAANLIWIGDGSTNAWNISTDQNWNNTTTPTNPDVFFNLDTVTFDNSSTNGNVALNTTVQPASVTVNNDAGHPYTISGTGNITGTGTTLSKQGVGTLILATNNTYGGNTTISGGVVQVGNGGAAGSLGTGTVTLSNNAALVFNLSGTPTVSNPINGAGSLEQKGPGTLIITSSNNYSGSTIIDTGTTLQLGNGGGTGNLGITSDVQDNGTLVFNRNNASTISAPITGTGSLQVTAGTLSLGANNSYMGTTTIAVGATLQVGSGGTTGSVGTGAFTNNGTLAFNRSDNITAPALSGSGALQQNGSGTLLLTGANSYSGATTVSNGTLAGLHPNAFGNTPAITISGATAVLSFRSDTTATFARPVDSTPYNVSATSTAATVDVNEATIAGSGAKTITIGNIDASASTGAATYTLTLTGANNTALTAGDIVGATPGSGNATNNIINNNVSGTTTISNYRQNPTPHGNDNVTFSGNGNTIITGGLQGVSDMNVTFAGPGNITIKGASSYSLTTFILAGTVAFGDDNSFGLSGLNLNAPDPAVGVLMSADSNTRTINGPITNSSTNFTFGSPTTGNLIFGQPGTPPNWDKGQFFKNLIVNCPVMTINDVVINNNSAGAANQALSKSGPGTLILTNANTYHCGTQVNTGTLVCANGTNGSATGSGDGIDPISLLVNANVLMNGGVLASDSSVGGTIFNNVVAGTGAHTIAPGGIGSIGFFTIGGLTSSNLTTLNFDLGSGAGPVISNGDLLTIDSSHITNPVVSVGAGTNISIGGSTVVGNDYRLIGGNIGGINLANFTLPAAPSGQSYSLSSSVDPGFIDLVVAVGPVFLTWNNTGGTGDGVNWDTTNQNWNNGSGPSLYSDGLAVTFNDTNNGHYAVTLNTTVMPLSTTVSNNSNTYTISGTGGIGGSGGLTKSGAGAFTISTVNTYTGNTVVNGGTMTIAAGGSIASPNVTVASGATLNAVGSLATTANVTSAGTVTFGASGSTATSTIQLASLTITAGTSSITASQHAATPKTLQSAAPLSITGTGKLNITNNILIAAGTVSTAQALIGNGSNGSVVTSIAGLALGYGTAGPGNFEIRATLLGDTDLDGQVNVADLANLAGNFGQTSGQVWLGGDFDYNGNVNVADLADLAGNFGKDLTSAGFGSGASSSSAAAAAAPAAVGAASAVPEPTSLGLLSIGAIGLMQRRRRAAVGQK
jgi:autotransporter-associated beta strand protein